MRNEILPNNLNCYELKTLPVITDKSENICEHLGLHKNFDSIAFRYSRVLFIAVSPGIGCRVHYYGLRKFRPEGL